MQPFPVGMPEHALIDGGHLTHTFPGPRESIFLVSNPMTCPVRRVKGGGDRTAPKSWGSTYLDNQGQTALKLYHDR